MKFPACAHAFAVIFLGLAVGAIAQQPTPFPSDLSVETIVFIRHGEKPPTDLGQLNCRGLNRALALPGVLLSKFGKPDYLFAPNPAGKIHKERGGGFYYLRPLATIEPTAIRLGLPVNVRFRFDAIRPLRAELTKKRYRKALIFVAWEHYQLTQTVKQLVARFGRDPALVPDWDPRDFDSIYVLRITGREGGKRTVSFRHDHEGLNYLEVACP